MQILGRRADICEKAGADTLLMTPPPYYHQTTNAEGIYEHYKTSPAILDIELFKQLANIENIIGIKDASGER